jgi:hypothetical protein
MPALLVVDEDRPSGALGMSAVSAMDYIKGDGAELPQGTVVRNSGCTQHNMQVSKLRRATSSSQRYSAMRSRAMMSLPKAL